MTFLRTARVSLRRLGLPVLALLAAAGCQGGDDNRVGAGLLPPLVDSTAAIRETVFTGDSLETDYEFEQQLVPGETSPTLVLAREMGHGSRALVRFGGLPLDAGTDLHSAEITLYVHDASPAGSMPRVLAYQLVQGFSATFTGTDVFPSWLPDPVVEGTPGKEAGEEGGDSLNVYRFGGEAVADLFRRWIQGTHVNAGLLLALAPDDSGRVVFESREGPSTPVDIRPRVQLVYGDTAAPDTLSTLPDDDTFLVERPPAETLAGMTDRLTVATGTSARSLLLFPVIPSLEQDIVHRAELVLSIDAAASHFDTASVEAELVVDYPWEGSDTGANLDIDGRGQAVAGVDTLAIDVTPLVREWVVGEENNTGVRLRFTNEGFGFDWIRFFASSSADSLRPRLRVVHGPAPAAVHP
jgi:hypothetical protein